MELVFAFAAGLLTMLNPCVLPVLPVALASGLGSSRTEPLALALGMSVSFTVLGVLVSLVGPGLGVTPEAVSRAFSLAMVAFGLVLLVPSLNQQFALATAGVATAAAHGMRRADGSAIPRQFLGGALLGAVWTPCIGPTLGGAIALASQGSDLGWATAIMLAFSAGVSSIVLAIAYGAQRFSQSDRRMLDRAARWAKPIAGVAFVLVGLAGFFGATERLVGTLLDAMPVWLQDLTVSI